MRDKSPLQHAQNLLQEATQLLEQNQLTQPIEELLKEAAEYFEAEGAWDLYLKSGIQRAIFYVKTSKYAIAEKHLIKELSKVKLLLSTGTIEVGDAYNQLATSVYYQAKYPLAQDYFEEALQVYRENYGEEHADTARTYSNLGNCMYAQGQVEEALKYYEKSLEVRQVVLPLNHPHFAFSYSALARCHNYKRNYKKALLFFQQALAIRIHQYGESHLMVSYSHTDIASCCINLWRYSQALEHSQKALAIRLKIYPKGHPSTAHCYSQIGDIYLKQQNHQEAVNVYQLAIKLQLKLLGENHPDVGYSYAQLGKCYLEIEPSESLPHLQKALKIHQHIYGNNHKKTAKLYDYIGRYYHKCEDYEPALQYYQRVINSLCSIPLESVSQAIVYQKPIIDNCLSVERLSKSLVWKAEIFCELYQQNHQLKEIQAAFEHAQQLIALLEEIRSQQSAEKEQLFLSEETASFYEMAIEIAWMMYEETGKKEVLEEAFLFAEKGKAAVLLSLLQKNTAKLQSDIPASLLEKVKYLEMELSELEKQVEITSDKQQLQKLQKNLFHATRQHEMLTTQLEREYPKYFQLKYKMPMVGVRELQATLKEKQMKNAANPTTLLLSYYVGEKWIYIYEITDDTYCVHRKEKSDDLEDIVLDFQDAVNLMDVDDYVEASSELYELLLAPVLEKHGLPIVVPQKLIILRHDVLDYLPFEALLTAVDEPSMLEYNFAELPYLIYHYEISYHYSTALLINKLQHSETTAIRQSSFLGMAPVSFNGNETVELELESHEGKSRVLRSNRAGEAALQNLPSTEMEVREVYQLFQDKSLDAKAFLYASASKSNLLKEASKHKYLLISTHGFVEDEEAGLTGIYLAKGGEEEVRSRKYEVGGKKREVGSEGRGDRGEESENRMQEVGSGKWEEGSKKREVGGKKREVGSGKREVGSGKREVGSGKWEEGSGKREVGGKKREVGSGKREVGGKKYDKKIGGEANEHISSQTHKHNYQPKHLNTQTPKHTNEYMLYTSDTYHLDLQADLVVLSSCSSGVGKLQKGEGMMAINRGFLYAGASNIIFTQFDIPDHSSSMLVKKLFEFILEGDTYSAALRKAKLHLLKEKTSSVQDWAGYLLIGI